ncbi:MAG: hypothetical protein ACI841_001246 [Planctomycetota bacterium]
MSSFTPFPQPPHFRMNVRHSITSAALLTAVLASAASAQQLRNKQPIQGPVKNAGIYHVLTDTWTRVGQTANLGPDILFRNDAPSIYFGELYQNEVFTDEGRIPTTASGANADIYTINGFEFGYCAMNVNPTSATFSWFDSYAPCSDPALLNPVGGITVTGMPNGGCWMVTIDMMGTPAEFDMEGDGADGIYDMSPNLDSFGFQFTIDNGQGSTTSAGPILTWEPTLEGVGTKWNNPGAVAGSGLGSLDFLWVDSTFVSPGCYFWGGYPSVASAHLNIYGDKAGGSPSVYCSGGDNSVAVGGGQMISNSGYGSAAADFTVNVIPNQPGIPFWGPNQPSFAFGCGIKCVGGTVVRGPVVFPMSNTVNFTVDMSATPAHNIQFWHRDPTFCTAAYGMSNAMQP